MIVLAAIIVWPTVLGLGVYHYLGYRPGGRYHR